MNDELFTNDRFFFWSAVLLCLFGALTLGEDSIWDTYWISNEEFYLSFLIGYSTCLFCVFLAICAKKKGRSPFWGLLGLTWFLGMYILYFIPKCSKDSDEKLETGDDTL